MYSHDLKWWSEMPPQYVPSKPWKLCNWMDKLESEPVNSFDDLNELKKELQDLNDALPENDQVALQRNDDGRILKTQRLEAGQQSV